MAATTIATGAKRRRKRIEETKVPQAAEIPRCMKHLYSARNQSYENDAKLAPLPSVSPRPSTPRSAATNSSRSSPELFAGHARAAQTYRSRPEAHTSEPQ